MDCGEIGRAAGVPVTTEYSVLVRYMQDTGKIQERYKNDTSVLYQGIPYLILILILYLILSSDGFLIDLLPPISYNYPESEVVDR